MTDLNSQVIETKKQQDKLDKKSKNNDRLVKLTFYITYVFLMTTATITFIESISTNDSKVRHILNLETCISIVAAFFYGKFVSLAEKNPESVPYKTINNTRYLDWSITTPIMLLVLVLALLYNNNGGALGFKSFLTILLIRNSTQSSILQLDGHFFFSGLPLQLLFLLHHLPMECLHLSEFTRLFLACQLVKNLNFREILFYKVQNLFALIYLISCHR